MDLYWSFTSLSKFLTVLTTTSKLKVKAGIFGADMKISLINDGPVTIIMDTKNKE